MSFHDAFDFFDPGLMGAEEAFAGASTFLPDFDFSGFNVDPGFEDLFSAQDFGLGFQGLEEAYLGASQAGGPGGQDFFFDTSAQEVVSPSGERTSLADIVRGGPQAPGREGALIQAPSGAGVGPGEPGTFDRGGMLGRGGPADRFLGSNLGGAAAVGALGLTGMGLSRLAAGSNPRLNFPEPRAIPGTATAEAALAEQAPQARAIRGQALGQIPGLMQPTGVEPFQDPIEAELQRQALELLRGEGGVSPQTRRRHQQEDQMERQRLFRQLGPDYELTTAGQEGLRNIKERQASEQYAEREGAIARRLQPQESRQQFAFQAPISRAQSLENIRRPALSDAERIGGGFGLTLAPGSQQMAELGTRADFQRAMTQYGQKSQQQRELGAGVGQLFGQVASAATRRRSPLEDYLEAYYGGTGGYGS